MIGIFPHKDTEGTVNVEEVAERYMMRKTLIVIEYLASQEKPDYRLIYRAAHVAVCENRHPKWEAWMEKLYRMMLLHGRVVKEGWLDRPE